MSLRRTLLKLLALTGLPAALRSAGAREPSAAAERMLRAIEADFRDTRASTGIAAPGPALRRALLLVPRERFVPPRASPAEATGRVLVRDVYRGRNMQGVRPGEIKKLLVLEQLPKPVSFSGMPFSFAYSCTSAAFVSAMSLE